MSTQRLQLSIAGSFAAAALVACGAFGGSDSSAPTGGGAGDSGSAEGAIADGASGSGDAAAIPTNDPCADGGKHRSMFVTSATFRGDLGAGDSGVVGLVAADARRKEAAASAGLPGTYVAWVSTTKAHPALTTQPGVPLLLPYQCQIVASDLADLGTTGPKVAINATESGGMVLGTCMVWSATSVSGTSQFTAQPDTNTCAEWTSAAALAAGGVGDCNERTSWSIFSNLPCDNDNGHIYCLQN